MNPNQLVELRDDRSGNKVRVRTINEEPSMTVQSDVARSEIRHILAKYEQTGVMIGLRSVDLAFRDVSEFTDFSDMLRQTKDAEAAFMQLPSKVREAFGHDVMQWLDAAHDGLSEDQRAKLVKAGVLQAVDDNTPPEAPAAPESEEE